MREQKEEGKRIKNRFAISCSDYNPGWTSLLSKGDERGRERIRVGYG